MGRRHVRVRAERPLVSLDGVADQLQVLQRHTEVEGGHRRFGLGGQSLAVVRLGRLHVPAFVQQPAQVQMRPDVARVEGKGSPVGVRGTVRCNGLQVQRQFVPSVGRELGGRRLRCRGSGDGLDLLGQLPDGEVEVDLARLGVPECPLFLHDHGVPVKRDVEGAQRPTLGKLLSEGMENLPYALHGDARVPEVPRGAEKDDVREGEPVIGSQAPWSDRRIRIWQRNGRGPGGCRGSRPPASWCILSSRARP